MSVWQKFRFATAALFATMAVVGFAQIRPDITPGEIVIATTPFADIFLDDAKLGAASSSGSFVIHSAKPGPHTLRVTKESKHPFTKRIVVAAGKTNQVRAELGDLTGDLEVLTAAGAEVMLNGKLAGTADGNGKLVIRRLSEETYKVRAAKAGRSSEEQQVSLAANLVSSINLELKLADEVNEGTTVSPPDYVLKRRLVSSAGTRVEEIFFQVNSGKLVSIGQNGNISYIAQWDQSTGRLVETVEVKTKYGIRAVSPDLRLAALEIRKPRPGEFNTHNSENSVQLVEAGTGRILGEWPGYYATFTPDSKRLAIQAWDHHEAVFWSIESGKQLETWAEGEKILYSPDGRLVATTGEEGITIRDAETGKKIQQLTKDCGSGGAFSPDDRWLALTSCYGQKVELWEIATGRQRRSFVAAPLGSEYLYFHSIVFTPDSAHIVAVTQASSVLEIAAHPPGILLLDTFTGREMRKWPAHNPLDIAVSSDGRWLALLDFDSSVTVWKRTD
jgi:WD40 repeat protein